MTTNTMPNLTSWEYDALKKSIRRWKVILPVVKDENGDVIDGLQRVKACEELGIADYPVLTLAGLTEDEKHDHSYILNLVRRRLNQDQMRELIAAELRRTPDLSDNWLAQILGTTDKTVAAVRNQLISSSEIPKLNALRGKDGKYRRVTRIVTNTAKEVERAQEALKYLGDKAPKKDLELRLAERQVKRVQRLKLTNGREIEAPGDGAIRIYHCPFQQLEKVAGLEPNSVNLVLTDIPYDGGFLPQVSELGAFAVRILVKGGLLVTYTGHFHLDHVMLILGEHLDYAWTAASVWNGDGTIIHPRQVTSKWKPILIYSKDKWKDRGRWQDLSVINTKEKEWHDWQEPLQEVSNLIRYFSNPGDLVVDPLAGGFTTAVACLQLGRRCVACDVDESAVIRGQDRLKLEYQKRKGSGRTSAEPRNTPVVRTITSQAQSS
jgi:site-specific DNA-methyltransferase (adenine-specific)